MISAIEDCSLGDNTYWGGDVGPLGYDKSYEDCKQDCDNNEKCLMYYHVPSQSQCYQKNIPDPANFVPRPGTTTMIKWCAAGKSHW